MGMNQEGKKRLINCKHIRLHMRTVQKPNLQTEKRSQLTRAAHPNQFEIFSLLAEAEQSLIELRNVVLHTLLRDGTERRARGRACVSLRQGGSGVGCLGATCYQLASANAACARHTARSASPSPADTAHVHTESSASHVWPTLPDLHGGRPRPRQSSAARPLLTHRLVHCRRRLLMLRRRRVAPRQQHGRALRADAAPILATRAGERGSGEHVC